MASRRFAVINGIDTERATCVWWRDTVVAMSTACNHTDVHRRAKMIERNYQVTA